MVNVITARKSFQNVLDENSEPVRFRYFNIAGSAIDYDDDVTLTKSGSDVWTSGNIQPFTGNDEPQNSSVAMHRLQGRIMQADLRCYVPGITNVSGLWRVGIGSPIRNEYAVVSNGVQSWIINGSDIYHKLFIRNLTTGSLQGE